MKEGLDNLVLDVFSKSKRVAKIVKDGEVLKDGGGRFYLEMNGFGSKITDLKNEVDTLIYSVTSFDWISAPSLRFYDNHPLREYISEVEKKLFDEFNRKGRSNKNQMYSKKD